MEFRIADTFTDSLSKLTGDEQKAVKTTAFDMQIDPSRPGLRFHRVDRARDPNFWSVRVSSDIRIIIHRTQKSLLLCYVDHHDDAYRWAQRRRLETHPRTGAAQLVEIRETVKEIEVPVYVQVEKLKPLPFAKISDDDLLNYGVPAEWLPDVRRADDNSLLDLADHLPVEAAEALLELATGGTPPLPTHTPPETDPFEHPDARRRFRVMHDVEELERALDYPWAKWVVFLHPAQRDLVERTYSGPARVSGSAGTGKTIVALHRAVHLARTNPDARVLLTTFSETLANALRSKLRILISSEPRLGERIEVYAIDALGERLYRLNLGKITLASSEQIHERIEEAAAAVGDSRFSTGFIRTEWDRVVDAWQLDTWDDYRDVPRLGRRRSLPETQRKALWSIFENVRASLKADGLITRAQMYGQLAHRFDETQRSPFDHVIVDECQDVGVSQLRFLRALGTDKPDGLFFTGDLGQRIFQQPFSWQALGIQIRGRARNLKVNYRTSHQIRRRSDLLLGPEIADVDGNTEVRSGTISVFNGAEPDIVVASSEEDEMETVAAWLSKLADENLAPEEISLFLRSSDQIDRATAAAEKAGLPYTFLDSDIQTTTGHISISTMHLAKGLEFRAVAVIACDDEVVPLQERIETVTDGADLEDVYNTERHLLYVACTRARDHLLVSGVDPASEFLDDLQLM
ncbi:MAG: AAA family ATPase [Caldilineaceae bacterium SB0661_bin_32]|uniref:DNA 3'-5' helicase n=1 Tax=Caldilineaceae bacterium SB0661_bin_32 TaxID=2605255 RepID=A0A6B1D5X0_9CHLR|nr:AAA family ATPase [Caldilineaceae bacterium SB0661_bin_32]